MNNKITFLSEFERNKHYRKHVVEGKENFPHSFNNSLDYEKGANLDIVNFSFFSFAKDAGVSYRLAYFRIVKSITTFAVTSSKNNQKLLTYFVPVNTYLPEFIYFSYSSFGIRRNLINFDPFQILPLDKKYTFELVSNWTTALEEEFIFERTSENSNISLEKFIFFLKKRENITIKSEYNHFERNLIALLKNTLTRKSNTTNIDLQDFSKELLHKIVDIDIQLSLLIKDNIINSVLFLIFMMAYFSWVYRNILHLSPTVLNSLTDHRLNLIFQAYQEVFNTLIEKKDTPHF